jgi:glycerol-3-phosphate dehydrogenase
VRRLPFTLGMSCISFTQMTLQIKPRPPLDGQHFHAVVIGGGINGAAIAREIARGGKKVLLVESNDFSSGTTSRSTRIIHGGLRYLEHGETDLVRESLRERQRLLRERPQLVHPTQFLFLLDQNSKRSAMTVRAGLWLYRRLGANNSNKSLTEFDIKRVEQALDAGRRWTLFNYEDAQCEFPERLVAEWVGEAAAAGAVVRNHTDALALNLAHGRVRGVLIRDRLTGKDHAVEASWVINCTGPWADRVCQRFALKMSKPLLGGVRGSHIVLRRFAGAPSTALYTEAADGRPIFVLPWNEQILVGTTEVADSDDPAKTVPSAEETQYLVQAVTKLFPKARISSRDIHYTFAGIRPLPYSPESKLSAVTRRHILHDHAAEGAGRLISVLGGKLTTAAALARQCARLVGCSTADASTAPVVATGALDPMLDQTIVEIARIGAVSEESARSLLEWFGKRALDVAHMAMVSPELRAPICPHSTHIVAEAVEAYRQEHAVTLGDVLLRRVPLALGSCWSETCSREAAMRIGAVMGWDDQQRGENLEAFEIERQAFLQKPPSAAAASPAAAD